MYVFSKDIHSNELELELFLLRENSQSYFQWGKSLGKLQPEATLHKRVTAGGEQLTYLSSGLLLDADIDLFRNGNRRVRNFLPVCFRRAFS